MASVQQCLVVRLEYVRKVVMNDVTRVKEHMGKAISVVLTGVDTPVNVVLVSVVIHYEM